MLRLIDDGRVATELSIGVLHLRTKTKVLEGIRTLSDICYRGKAALLQLPSIGRRTVGELVHNHIALQNAVELGGGICWEVYCASVGIPLLQNRLSVDGHEFLSELPAILVALANVLDDKVLAAILLDRFSKSPTDQKTLEKIGADAFPALTRERVRQKGRKLLEQITGVLALIGILIRNSVILVVQVEDNIHEGMPSWDAVIEATKHRMRPIILTAAAASLALIPISRDVFWGLWPMR